MNGIKNWFRPKTERATKTAQEALREPRGLAAYQTVCESLKAKFDTKFTPENKESSELIYRKAKRIDRLLMGPFYGLFGAGGFGRDNSAAKLRAPNAIRATQPLRDTAAARAEKMMRTLEGYMQDIETVISPNLLVSPQEVAIQPLPFFKARHGDSPEDDPVCDEYESYMEASAADMMRLLSPLIGVKDAGAVILPENFTAIRSLYQTFLTDHQFWRAFTETARTTDTDVIANDAFEAQAKINHLIANGITKPYERTFSPGGRAEGDIAIDNFLFGRKDKIEVDFKEPVSDSVPEGFADPKGYFEVLAMSPQDIGDKKESEIKSMLKSHYYRQAKAYYPDANRGEPSALERMQRINAAYEILSDTEKRNSYLRGP